MSSCSPRSTSSDRRDGPGADGVEALSHLPFSNDPHAMLARLDAAATPLPISVWPIPAAGAIDEDVHHTDRIFVAESGQGKRTYWRGTQRRDLYTAPSMVEVYGAGTDFRNCRWEGQPGRCVLVEFEAPAVQALSHGEIACLRLATQHEVFDRRVSSLVFALATDALAGSPDGRLYSEGLAVALVAALAGSYRADRRPPPREAHGRLSAGQCHRLKELVDGEIGSRLSLLRLADEVALSPHHFIRVFKTTFGKTPHQFVQERRIQLAAESLRQGAGKPLAEVALQYGFASQSHMTTLMRRHLGVTPALLRREADRGPGD